MARDYDKEYKNYHSRPEQVKNRAKRNAARAQLEKEGRVRKGDGNDVDHIRPISKGGGNSRGNLRVKDKNDNRSYKRDSKGRMK